MVDAQGEEQRLTAASGPGPAGPRAGSPSSAPRELAQIAAEVAAAGSATALAWAERLPELEVEEKADADDLVSRADREAEQEMRLVLSRRRPDDAVVGEEHGTSTGAGGVHWLLDPIDGTTSYLYGRADWAVSVAAVSDEDGRVLAGAVAEPSLGRLTQASLGGGTWAGGEPARCSACTDLRRALVEVNLGRREQRHEVGRQIAAMTGSVRDLRRGGSAAGALAQVATGRADAYWGPGLQPWDGAAGMLLVTEAGGVAGDLGGRTEGVWPDSGDILAATEPIWEPLRRLLALR